MQATISANTAPHLFSLVPHATEFARVPESLLFVFAVSILEMALLHYREQDRFRCQRSTLGALMNASKSSLPWQDFDVLAAIRDRRNMVAHEATLLDVGECASALDSIARELLAWGALEMDYRGRVGISMSPTQSSEGKQ